MRIPNPFEKVDKKQAIFFAGFLTVFALVFFGAKYLNIDLNSAGITFFIITLSLLTLVTWSMAGIVVFRALFFIGASFTLMIFLAQTYCDVPAASRTADAALQSLFGFGVLYIGFLFFNSLRKELSQSLSHLGDVYDGKKPWLIVTLFGLFVGLFVWQLYQVIHPVILNLCIYN